MKGPAILVTCIAACTEASGELALSSSGPPAVMQIFVAERVDSVVDGQLAYGDHPDIAADDDRVVTSAVPRRGGRIRIVIDELLDGSTLQQIGCADGSFDDIPRGATPDDILACTGIDRSRCTAVCTHAAAGLGTPTGVLDEAGAGSDRDGDGIGDEPDGVADQLRLRATCPDGRINGCRADELARGAVIGVVCDGAEQPISLVDSFYSPSGSQRWDPRRGSESLGPAIVVTPVHLPPGRACSVRLGDAVLDKQSESLVLPDEMSFSVEALAAEAADPLPDEVVDAAAQRRVRVLFNADLAPASLGGVALLDLDRQQVVPATVGLDVDEPSLLVIEPLAALQPGTVYAGLVPGGTEGVRDRFGGTLAEDFVLVFATTPAPAVRMGTSSAGPVHFERSIAGRALEGTRITKRLGRSERTSGDALRH